MNFKTKAAVAATLLALAVAAPAMAQDTAAAPTATVQEEDDGFDLGWLGLLGLAGLLGLRRRDNSAATAARAH